MTTDLGPGFCWTCGEPYPTAAALDAHQLETGHEMDQPDHPLRHLATQETAMTRSEYLATMTTTGLREEREACLKLTTDGYGGTEPVKEFHADCADRISDELDHRNNT